jgi:hypothetical protein
MNEATASEAIREVARLVKQSWPTLTHEREAFTEDQMIEAWKLGVAQGGKLASDLGKESLRKLLGKNIRFTFDLCKDVRNVLKSKNLGATKVYLNIQNYDALRVLFVIPEQDYCSEEFLSVLADASMREKYADSEALDLSIEFMPDASELDSEQLTSDGYIWPQDLSAV